MNLYIGSKWNQICDSKGPHNPATLIDVPEGATYVRWLPTLRVNTPDYEQKWGGKFSWDNLYCWCSLPISLPLGVLRFAYCVDVTVADLSNLNAFEFEKQAVRQRQLYNQAWQFRQQAPGAFTFDFTDKQWTPAFPLTAPVLAIGKLTRFCALYEMLPEGTHHVGVQYNGMYTPVNVLRPWVATGEGDYLNFAFQFDSLNKGTEIAATVNARLVVVD